MSTPPILDLVRRGLRPPLLPGVTCMVCRGRVSASEPQVRLRGGPVVHRRCATYSMRRPRGGAERLGFHPR
jgi:hypothetical protein